MPQPPEDATLPALQENLPSGPLGPAAMLQSAIARGVAVEGIKTLAEIYERWEAKRAEREFTEALMAFSAECPPILKTDVGVHRAKFAPLDKIAAIVDPILRRHGLMYTFNTLELKENEKRITCVCKLRHVGGHSTDTLFSAPIDPAPGMSQTHAGASAQSFAKRYALQNALGIVTSGADDDGQAATGGPPINEEQRHTLEVLLEETKLSDSAAFWKFTGIEKGRLADLPARDYQKVQQALLQKKKGGGK